MQTIRFVDGGKLSNQMFVPYRPTSPIRNPHPVPQPAGGIFQVQDCIDEVVDEAVPSHLFVGDVKADLHLAQGHDDLCTVYLAGDFCLQTLLFECGLYECPGRRGIDLGEALTSQIFLLDRNIPVWLAASRERLLRDPRPLRLRLRCQKLIDKL